MSAISIIRRVVLGVTTTFSVVVLAISAHLISQTQLYLRTTATFCALGVAIGALTFVTLPVMAVVDRVRQGAFTSMIVVELVWLSVLWVLWVATAGETAYTEQIVSPYGCDYLNPIANGMCQQAQAVEAFSFLNFIILLLYTVTLLVMAVIAASRGQSVWLSSVKETFGSDSGPVQHPMAVYNPSVAPAGIPAQPTPVQHTPVQHTPVQPQYPAGVNYV